MLCDCEKGLFRGGFGLRFGVISLHLDLPESEQQGARVIDELVWCLYRRHSCSIRFELWGEVRGGEHCGFAREIRSVIEKQPDVMREIKEMALMRRGLVYTHSSHCGGKVREKVVLSWEISAGVV